MINSVLYELKDLLRGSVISYSVEQTENILEVLSSIKNAKVYLFKNGFISTEDKPFMKENYADLKLIMIVGNEEEYEYQELVEIQIIQRINIQLKKLEHKA